MSEQFESELRRRLPQAFPTPEIPADIDDAIRREARRHLTMGPSSRRRRSKDRDHRLTGTTLRVAALAASLTVAIIVPSFFEKNNSHSPAEVVARLGDLDADGTIDLRDVHQLARHLQSEATSPNRAGSARARARSDLDDNRRVDQRDLDLLTALVVRTSKGSR